MKVNINPRDDFEVAVLAFAEEFERRLKAKGAHTDYTLIVNEDTERTERAALYERHYGIPVVNILHNGNVYDGDVIGNVLTGHINWKRLID